MQWTDAFLVLSVYLGKVLQQNFNYVYGACLDCAVQRRALVHQFHVDVRDESMLGGFLVENICYSLDVSVRDCVNELFVCDLLAVPPLVPRNNFIFPKAPFRVHEKRTLTRNTAHD